MDNKKTYTRPTANVFCINIRPLMAGSISINIASENYDGRPVMSRESSFSTWGDDYAED